MIDVIAAAKDRVFSPNYRNRTWLASEMTTLLNSQAWSVLGGLALHAALAAAPLTGDLAQHLATARPCPRSRTGRSPQRSPRTSPPPPRPGATCRPRPCAWPGP